MKVSQPLNGITIYHGDCRDVLAQLEPESVQCCVTSPPYWGLRDYGIPPSVWGGAKDCDHRWGASRVLSVDNSDKRRWNHSVNGRGEEQPEEKQLVRKSGEVSQGQFCQLCGAWLGNLGLEPTPELFVEHIVEVFEAVRRVLKDDGTLWLNMGDSYNNAGSSRNGEGLDGTRRGGATGADGECGYKKRDNRNALKQFGIKCKDLVGIPWACAFALRSAGWYLRSDIIWHKPNPMPESVTDRPTKSYEYIFLLAKSERYYYDADAIKEASEYPDDDRKARQKPEDYDSMMGPKGQIRSVINPSGVGIYEKRNKRSVWTVPTKPVKEAHFATFPPKLIEPCILTGCPEGGTVLDPFSGSGTTAKVCKALGRRFVGAELNPEYVKIAEKRIGAQEVLF